jgi:hypothetical protein
MLWTAEVRFAGDDKQLGQRVLHALPQLIVAGNALLPEVSCTNPFVRSVLNEQRGVAFDVAGRAGRIVDDQGLLDGRLMQRGRMANCSLSQAW